MPSPIPLTRFLPREFSPSVDSRPCSSPLERPGRAGALSLGGTPFPRARRLPPRLAWCSIDWEGVCFLQRLGAGGFGSVYKATYHGVTVAVKQVKKCSKNRLASRQSFWAELNVARLRHANVVRVVAASTCAPADHDSLGTIIMEYTGSTTLHHVIYGASSCQEEGGGVGRGCLNLVTCLKYSLDVASGLLFLHSQGVVHLDLKPANILITERDTCKIGDFGCSQRLEDPVGSGPQHCHLGGTYTHRAPELLKGETVTPKADIYSFAITLWQMATKEVPYSGDRHYVVYAVVAYNLRPSLSAAIFSESPPGQRLQGIIDRCWASSTLHRPTAELLLCDLGSLSADLGRLYS
ncbi:proto-oncogene serine/threonine-protein kinase mos [Ornithorhynchus anatinus]|uniref:Proto-oncogene serine/threonine-protein kinase mos n=1 Tax=Ornithorhynchus anatinus TaxID=9258 RepID=A0A6I8P7Q2_ORNAN|nr:proto-oncogene serine/threonine-protein kinase mos [Ornithorhynchus anatinus]